ncbi:hypothetical protein Cgig2_006360 [Carnegiea gigantea]|uniref:PGG domain-containing protein n=1 Tax=Carnegiea gigantea TaxID=171969 RepID=A0A9Q1Q4V4_9CARY|nr:hypothetical protein Cgig2_006360 [Carnegiea gigantea]
MLKQAYVKPPMKKDLASMRQLLSVVAGAVLLQLTIAARLTLPIGFESFDYDTSREAATMEKKAAFSVFLLAEIIAICCSMSALFCIVWSMSSDADKSMTLLYRTVPLLMVALVGTLLVFVTGVPLVSPVSLWTTSGRVEFIPFRCLNAGVGVCWMPQSLGPQKRWKDEQTVKQI